MLSFRNSFEINVILIQTVSFKFFSLIKKDFMPLFERLYCRLEDQQTNLEKIQFPRLKGLMFGIIKRTNI